jgi:hypothetical protein
MDPNLNERWSKIELLLLRSYLLFHTGSSLLELFARKINEFGHSLSLW